MTGLNDLPQPVTSDRPARPDDDAYWTPPEATRALLSVEKFAGGIWDPCAGAGWMAAVLRQAGYTVAATTIGEGRHDRDAPKHRVIGGHDFLVERNLRHPNIITNPPYRHTETILRHALDLGAVKICLLLNIKFLTGRARRTGLFREAMPTRIWLFSDRVTMYPAGYDGPKGTTTESMAWFVWEAPFHRRPAMIDLIDSNDFKGDGRDAA